MKKIWLLACWIVVGTIGCQVTEIYQGTPLVGEVELSNVEAETGRPFESDATSYYIFDLGPIYEGSITRALDGETGRNNHVVQVRITAQYDWLDTIWRILQMGAIGLPAIGSRTIYVEGVEVQPRPPS